MRGDLWFVAGYKWPGGGLFERRRKDVSASWTTLLLILVLLSILVWVAFLFRTTRFLQLLRRLPFAAPANSSLAPFKVSAIVASRNEGGSLPGTIRMLLDQDGVEMQVVVVDDQSTDGSGEILSQLAAQDDRVLVLTNKKLPPGWLAKNYALELGQARAAGEWLLFIDADVSLGRRAVFNAIAAMEREHLDHLTLCPRLETAGFWESVVLPLYVVFTHARFVDIRAVDPTSGKGAGIGAFNLVRADSYRLRGTHARIRSALMDDRALGQMMREDEGRGSVMRAVAQVRKRPFKSKVDLYAGIRKGFIAASGTSGILAMFAAGLSAFVGLAPIGLIALLGMPVNSAIETLGIGLLAILAWCLPIVSLLRMEVPPNGRRLMLMEAFHTCNTSTCTCV